MSFSASTHITWLRRTLIACRYCPHLQITSRMCSMIDKWFVTILFIITPRILIYVTRWMSGSVGGYWAWDLRLRSSKMISTDLGRFSGKLFLWAHSVTWSSSASLDWAFLAGIRHTMYVSSAYLCTEFPCVTVGRSDALMTWDDRTLGQLQNLGLCWLRYPPHVMLILDIWCSVYGQ